MLKSPWELSSHVTNNKLEEVSILDTLECVPYADEDQNEMTFPDLDEEITSGVGDKYVHASMMLPCGSQTMHGTVIACKQDHNGNPWVASQTTLS